MQIDERPIMDERPKLFNRYRRLNNLYRVIDDKAQEVTFKMRPEQLKLYDLEKQNKRLVILKARQL